MKPVGTGPEEGSAPQSDPADRRLVGAWVGLPAGSTRTEPGSEKLTLGARRREGAGTGSMCLSSQQLAGGTPGFCRPLGVAGVGTGPCLSATEAQPRPHPSLLRAICVWSFRTPHCPHGSETAGPAPAPI